MRSALTVIVVMFLVVTVFIVTGCNSNSGYSPSSSDSEEPEYVDTDAAEETGYGQGYNTGYDGYYYENVTDYDDADIPDGGYSTEAENDAFGEGWVSGWNAGMDDAMQDSMDEAAEQGERW